MHVSSPHSFPFSIIDRVQALILPDEAINLNVTAYIDNNSAAELNFTKRDLTVTLILRTLTGNDHFITVTGKYRTCPLWYPIYVETSGMLIELSVPTCFANPLSILTRLPGPIRSVGLEPSSGLDQVQNPLNAPREMLRLVGWLMSAHIDIVGFET